MNNKGFIATSLIYSFFLIFITLFLTIIADYLQNKVLLNTIEKGIKDNINNTKSIEDFEMGDIITINNSDGIKIGENVLANNSTWIIANINFDDKVSEKDESYIILYNLNATFNNPKKEDISEGKIVTYNQIIKDLKISNDNNNTNVTELINTSLDDYSFYDGNETKQSINKQCFKFVYDEPNYDDCTTTASVYRERIVISPFNAKVIVKPDASGGFILEGVNNNNE